MNENKRSLIFDANNILYRTFFAQIHEAEDIVIGMCHHSALWSLNKYYRQYPADEIVVAFDSHSWRKIYTENLDECITYKKYKGNRRKNLTPSQQKKLDSFDQHVKEFAEMLKTQTSLLVLAKNYLEADDLIAGYIQSNPYMDHVLISADKDYMQLLLKHKLTIIDPDKGNPRSLSEWNNDPDYFLFEKCIRGDTSDNIISAYPRLRKTKIIEAYKDAYAREAIMNNSFKALINDDDEASPIKEKILLTRDVFEENDYLMNLESQPSSVRKLITTTINEAIENRGKFNYVSFIKFCGKYKLNNILDKIDQFVPLLANQKFRI